MPIKRTLTLEITSVENATVTVEVTWPDAEILLRDLAEALNKHIVSEAPVSPSKGLEHSQGSSYEVYPERGLGAHTDPFSDEATGRGSPMTYDKGVPPIKRGAMAEIAVDEELSPQTKAELEAYYGRKAPGEAPAPVVDDEWSALKAVRQGSAPGFGRDVGSTPGGSDRQRSS